MDTRQAYNNYAFQAGVGAEALSRNVELRVNGYIPFANQSDLYQSGYTNAYLRNNQLILDGWNRYVVSLGGTNLEAGIPLARWSNNSLWLYASYYYLDGDYVNGSSGVRGRGKLRLGNQLAIGATVSYDAIFDTQATGYVRYGAKPLAGSAKDAVDAAERNFLALRGLPMQRDVDLRMVSAQQNLPGSVATNPGNGGANWVVRCTGTTTNTGTANVSCANPSLDALLAAAGPGDVLLVGGGASSNLGGQTLRLAVGTNLTGSGSAPTLATQFGGVNLNPVFGTAVGAQAAFNNGIISIGSNTTIAGFSFTNTSITNYSTSNVLIANNSFTGSYTDNPTDLATAQAFGSINVSANALPAIQLNGVDNLTITNNTFLYPQVQTYVSQLGTLDGGGNSPSLQSKRGQHQRPLPERQRHPPQQQHQHRHLKQQRGRRPRRGLPYQQPLRHPADRQQQHLQHADGPRQQHRHRHHRRPEPGHIHRHHQQQLLQQQQPWRLSHRHLRQPKRRSRCLDNCTKAQ